jgi:hypothetical protein
LDGGRRESDNAASWVSAATRDPASIEKPFMRARVSGFLFIFRQFGNERQRFRPLALATGMAGVN